MLLLSIIILIAIFFLNLIIGMYYGFGFRHYWFFELLHFLGGFFTAMLFYNFFKPPKEIFTAAAIISLSWEALEYLLAKIPKYNAYLQKRFKIQNPALSFKDTILDLILDFSGAGVFLLIVK